MIDFASGILKFADIHTLDTKMLTKMHPLEKFHYCPRCGSNEFIENNESSKRCSACGFVYYFNPRAAVVALIKNERNELLVCKRAKEPAKGTLDLPGGFTDLYETAEEAVIREVKEETDLAVDSVKYLFSLPNVYTYSDFDVHTMDLFFECRVTDFSALVARDDVADVLFMPINEIHPSDFGLSSIRKGIGNYVKMQSNKINC